MVLYDWPVKKRTRKALAYIVRDGQLLVFVQPQSPDAGVQVPAGTVRSSEEPEAAVVREVAEETGLTDVDVVECLGVYEYDMSEYGREEVQERHVFQLQVTGPVSRGWTHYEEHDGLAPPEPFSFFWLPLAEARARGLEAGQGALLDRLSQETGQSDGA